MSDSTLPLVISAPEPRTLDLIFTPPQLARFRKTYRIVEATPDAPDGREVWAHRLVEAPARAQAPEGTKPVALAPSG